MLITVLNKSKKKAFRKSKRIINAVIQPINNRVSISSVPKRVLFELISNLKKSVTKGTSVEIYIEDKEGFRGVKCIVVGKNYGNTLFTQTPSGLDKSLKALKII